MRAEVVCEGPEATTQRTRAAIRRSEKRRSIVPTAAFRLDQGSSLGQHEGEDTGRSGEGEADIPAVPK
jgi:hypothetical protein